MFPNTSSHVIKKKSRLARSLRKMRNRLETGTSRASPLMMLAKNSWSVVSPDIPTMLIVELGTENPMHFANLVTLTLAATLASAKVYFQETFEASSLPTRWIQSESKSDYGKWAISSGKFFADKKESRGLQTSQDARFYSISAPLDEVFDNKDKDLVLQFTAKFEQNIDCGGGYIKLMPKMDPKKFNGDTPYSIMFGPDICGSDRKIHAILNYKGDNKLIKKSIAPGSDQMTHQYTFILHPDQTFSILLDGESKETGSILESWDLLPPRTIKDPSASKPADWVDSATIANPDDVKPAGWDDIPATIVDPEAEMPEDWDEEMDGEWEAPKIANPEYMGEWKAEQIPNPAYKGVWVHPEIENPDFEEDTSIYHSTNTHLGFDLWQVKSGTIFDNIIVTDSVAEAAAFGKKHFEDLQEKEKAAKDAFDAEEKKVAEAEAKKRADEADEELKKGKGEEVEEVETEESEVEHEEL
ncbi:Calreticulin-1 [Podochytrium sp. JEL0797]|nr:Calreticulin-1 [Podochytrium sp. JEL0797]